MVFRSARAVAAAGSVFRKFPLHRVIRPWYGGVGTILVLHRVRPVSKLPRLTASSRLEITPEYLTEILEFAIRAGFDVVSLDEAWRRLRGEGKGRRFLCFTFDDGYSDNHQYAYPLFKRFGLPFAVYITTGFIEKRSVLWHYMLERLLLQQDEVRYCDESSEQVISTDTMERKEAAYWRLSAKIIASHPSRWPRLFESLFDGTGIDARNHRDETMSWDQVEELAADPLVTIGAHTVNHYNLAVLDDADARWEITEAKRRLESRLNRPVDHLAYPFGLARHAGEREFRLARQAGFKTATTTREGNLFPEHQKFAMCLPRIEVTGRHQHVSMLDMRLSGVMSLLRYGPKRVVTA